MPSRDRPSVVTCVPASLEERALLTYQAMSNSDDIVLLLERGPDTEISVPVIIGANEAFGRASGYSADQLCGRAVADLFPIGNHAETLLNAIQGSASPRCELACSRAGGGTFMLGMHLMPAPVRTDGKICFVVLGRDITAVIEARQVQNASQRLLANVFSSVDVAVAITNGTGRIVMTNPHVDLLLGYKPNGLIGRSTMELVAPEARTAISTILKQQLEDGLDKTYSAPILQADGSWLPVKVTSVLTTSGDAKQFRILTVRPDSPTSLPIRTETVGRIKLVGLDEVRAALADRWPEVAARVMATAETVLKRNCGPQDTYSRPDDTGFLVCFGDLSEEEASFRAAMIGREIRNQLIDQGESSDCTAVRSIAAVIQIPNDGRAGVSLDATLLEGLDKQLQQMEEHARQSLVSLVASATCEVEQVFGRNPGQVVASAVLIPNKLERQLVCALAALPLNEADAFDQTSLLLRLAAKQAVADLMRGDNKPLLITIGFDNFSTRARTERFFAVCAKIDPRITGRMILLLSSLPRILPRTRVQDCVNRLRLFCRGVGYQVNEVSELPQIDLTTSFNPVVALPQTACAMSEPDEVKKLFSSLQSRRVKVLVREVVSEKDAVRLRFLGADMIWMQQPKA